MSSVSQADIDEKMANAQANSYFLDDMLHKVTVDEIVADLQDHDADCCYIDHDVLEPLVQNWYDRHCPEACR